MKTFQHRGKAVVLGRRPARFDFRTLRFAKYASLSDLPPAPLSKNWGEAVGIDLGMMGNDAVGDCTCAALAHAIQTWTANGSNIALPHGELELDAASVLDMYSKITGYNPNDPETDQGAVELDVLRYVKRFGFSGLPIDAFVSIEPMNHDHVRQAIALFGGVYIGVALPISAQDQAVWTDDDRFDKSGAPGSWGGHAVWVPSYDVDGVTCVTWGGLQRMTWGFWDSYVDEAYALLSSVWAPPEGLSPSGFKFAELSADLASLA